MKLLADFDRPIDGMMIGYLWARVPYSIYRHGHTHTHIYIYIYLYSHTHKRTRIHLCHEGCEQTDRPRP